MLRCVCVVLVVVVVVVSIFVSTFLLRRVLYVGNDTWFDGLMPGETFVPLAWIDEVCAWPLGADADMGMIVAHSYSLYQ